MPHLNPNSTPLHHRSENCLNYSQQQQYIVGGGCYSARSQQQQQQQYPPPPPAPNSFSPFKPLEGLGNSNGTDSSSVGCCNSARAAMHRQFSKFLGFKIWLASGWEDL